MNEIIVINGVEYAPVNRTVRRGGVVKIKVRARGVALDEKSPLNRVISQHAHLLGMVEWTISPYSVTLRVAETAAWIDLSAALNAMARALGGSIKCAATGGYHYEIEVSECDRRTA